MEKTMKHASLVFRGSSYGEFGTMSGNNMTAELLNEMQSGVYDFVRGTAEFKALEKRLETTAVGRWGRG